MPSSISNNTPPSVPTGAKSDPAQQTTAPENQRLSVDKNSSISTYQTIINQALRENLPKQIPLHKVLQTLKSSLDTQALNPQKATSTTPLTTKLIVIIDRILGLLEAANTTNADKIKQAIVNSGGFMEARLLSSHTTEQLQQRLNTDIKSLLLQLSSQLFAMTSGTNNNSNELNHGLFKQLLRQAMGALARIQLQQIESLSTLLSSKTSPQQASQNQHQWQLDIPLFYGNNIETAQLRIKEDLQEGKKEETPELIKRWTITLEFDLHEWGEMVAEAVLVGNSVSTKLWLSHADTFVKTKNELALLRQALTEGGVHVDTIDCLHGKPNKSSRIFEQQLIDVHT